MKNMSTTNTAVYDAIVVGGGAAGMLAAGELARAGVKTALVERNERPGWKLAITGKGRCNLTNDCSSDEFFAHVMTNPRFLRSAFSAFTPQDTMDFFAKQGVALKVERGNRVFPASDQALDVVGALRRWCAPATYCQGRVSSLLMEETQVSGVLLDNGQRLLASRVLIATGGLSYPKTGSTGDGYLLAAQAGHTIVPQRASLTGVQCLERAQCRKMQGLSLKNVTLNLYDSHGKCLFSQQGEMLFTHFGVSGPLVLSASALMKEIESTPYRMTVDFKPALSADQLDERLQRDIAAAPKKSLSTLLSGLLPASAVSVFLERLGESAERSNAELTRVLRERIGSLCKEFTLHAVALCPIEEAVVTAGGVSVLEVNPKTMESKRCQGLYFAGEVLDVDATTGGFNLQIAFCTAMAAAKAIITEWSVQ